MSEQHGGPAFPMPHSDQPGSYETHPGMTLRDWFAGQALVGQILARPSAMSDDVAERCYIMADAMLAARATGEQA